MRYQIQLATENSKIWNYAPASFPSDPAPDNWAEMSFKEKRQNTIEHERKHVTAYEKWYDARKFRIEGSEQLVYPDESQCLQRANLMIKENSDGFEQLEQDEIDHKGW